MSGAPPAGNAQSFTIRRIAATACRVPLERPLAASFGVMSSRPAVFVRIEDEAGCFGFGEVFANWPADVGGYSADGARAPLCLTAGHAARA